MKTVGWIFGGSRRFEIAQRLGRLTQRPFLHGKTIRRFPWPLSSWTRTRDLRPLSGQTFRDWWRRRP
jgi:L-lactate dehydrogenase complex protein LldF